jgi:hypothetical protein
MRLELGNMRKIQCGFVPQASLVGNHTLLTAPLLPAQEHRVIVWQCSRLPFVLSLLNDACFWINSGQTSYDNVDMQCDLTQLDQRIILPPLLRSFGLYFGLDLARAIPSIGALIA